MRSSFSLFKKKTGNGLMWYVRFWNEKANDYTIFRSTGILVEGKRERRKEAEQKAQEMLSEIRLDMEAVDRPLITYLEEFWKPDSPYVKECANIKKKPLSTYYVHQNSVNVRLHIKPCPLFNKITLRKLTAGLIKDWMSWCIDQKMSGRKINSVLSSMRVAVHYAVEREELDKNPFRNIKPVTETPKEKGVLTFAERMKLLNTIPPDPLSRLAVLLGLLCGMRMGEVRGLHWSDIDNGLIHLTHNFVHMEGLKKPKRGKTRTVPYPAIIEKVFEEVREIAISPATNNYIFESIKCPGQPMFEIFFKNALRRELSNISISLDEQKKRNITFHSLRHSFITLSRLDGISDLEIQAVAGHSSRRMMEHYTHADKVIDFTAVREKMGRVAGL
ncbi:MAG: tyrosine-type recombinase/integrase [Treponema sp.]|nr:tyrosine-type recombinase/integrase [Treponema sp.]